MPRFVYDAAQVRILQREGRVVPVPWPPPTD